MCNLCISSDCFSDAEGFVEYQLQTTDGCARRGRLIFERSVVETPAFMPVGTYGTVKGMTPEEVKETSAQILLGNTFHLWLRPGQTIMKLPVTCTISCSGTARSSLIPVAFKCLAWAQCATLKRKVSISVTRSTATEYFLAPKIDRNSV